MFSRVYPGLLAQKQKTRAWVPVNPFMRWSADVAVLKNAKMGFLCYFAFSFNLYRDAALFSARPLRSSALLENFGRDFRKVLVVPTVGGALMMGPLTDVREQRYRAQ